MRLEGSDDSLNKWPDFGISTYEVKIINKKLLL
jgi:hypothetical protein